MTAQRTSRIELRAVPERVQRIRYAARLEHQSVHAFVLDAAAARAEEVIASASATVVPSDVFDQLWTAVESPAPSAVLQRRAQAPRRVDQR